MSLPMHEFSLCQSLIHAVESELEQLDVLPGRLVKVRVVVGELRQVVPDFMESAYTALTNDTPLAGTVLSLRFIPIRVRCEHCGWEGEIKPPIFQCAECKVFGVEVLAGKELFLDGLVFEEQS